GCGIPEDALEHVFERFYRVDKARSRATGGTGLGLPIARSIISLHHGDIKAYSKMGEGTTFVVRIPLHFIPEEENKDE
ncbi:MAG: two-component sensor histidine kinase, partial [Lachnospiraceae bacterium]|nr:two-component sensor histidine kinase [Lachnospiraceae bacterium]